MPNYSIPGLMDIQTPKADEDSTHVILPNDPNAVYHGDGEWRPLPEVIPVDNEAVNAAIAEFPPSSRIAIGLDVEEVETVLPLLRLGTEPQPHQQWFIQDERRWARFVGTTNEDAMGLRISGMPDADWDGPYVRVGRDDEGSRGVYEGDLGSVYYNYELGRFEIGEPGSITAYSSAAGYTHPFAPELTWYDAADDSQLELTVLGNQIASRDCWELSVGDIPIGSDQVYVRGVYGWEALVPESLSAIIIDNPQMIRSAAGMQPETVQGFQDLLRLSPDPDNHATFFIEQLRCYAKFVGVDDDALVGLRINNPGWGSHQVETAYTNAGVGAGSRHSYAGIGLVDFVVYNSEEQRYEFRTQLDGGGDLKAFSSATAPTYPFDDGLAWFDGATEGSVSPGVERNESSTWQSWVVLPADVDPPADELTDEFYLRKRFGWEQVTPESMALFLSLGSAAQSDTSDFLASGARGSANGVASLDGDGLVPANQIPDIAQSKVTGLTDALSGKIATTARGSANGVASLDGDGLIPAGQMPSIALSEDLGNVANEAAMLALAGQIGDCAYREDLGSIWMIRGGDPSLLSSWREISYPAARVSSVAGLVGTITAAGLKAALDLEIGIDIPALAHTHGTSGIDDGAITMAKLANLAAGAFIGRPSGSGTGVPVALSAAQIKTIVEAALASGGNVSLLPGGALGITMYPSGGVFVGTSPVDPGAGVLRVGNTKISSNRIEQVDQGGPLFYIVGKGGNTLLMDLSVTYLSSSLVLDNVANYLSINRDTYLYRDAPNTFAQKNGANAQKHRVYGTTTGSKYAQIEHDGTKAILSSSSGGIVVQNQIVEERDVGDDNATLVAADVGKVVAVTSGSARNWTVPADTDVNFPVGSVIAGTTRGAGAVTINPGSGSVVLEAKGNALTTDGQYSKWAVRKRAPNTWEVSGQLTP